jgi:DNA-binding LacI/PurR family transcriptional regulator
MELMLEQIFQRAELFLPTLLAASVLTGMVISAVTRVLTTASRERTRREIAAYVAEGSMTPEQAERMLKAGQSRTVG